MKREEYERAVKMLVDMARTIAGTHAQSPAEFADIMRALSTDTSAGIADCIVENERRRALLTI